MLLDLSDSLLGGVRPYAIAAEPRDPVLHRSHDPVVGEFTIKVASSDSDREAAEEIINRLYSWRGYGEHHQLADRETCKTFMACRNGEVLGTLTLTVDSPRRLGVDETFPDELCHIRQRGAGLCELTKFAFDPSPGSQGMLAALFHVIYLYGTQLYDCTDLLIEVNPRHVRFYQVMLGFKRVGDLRTNAAVSAPSQLLRLGIADIDHQIVSLAGSAGITNHSLYPHFFGEEQAEAIREKIVALAKYDATGWPALNRRFESVGTGPGWSTHRQPARLPQEQRAAA